MELGGFERPTFWVRSKIEIKRSEEHTSELQSHA